MCPDKDAGMAVEEAPESQVGPTEAPVAPDPGAPATEPLAPQEPSGEEESGEEKGKEAGGEQPPELSVHERYEQMAKDDPEFRAEAEKHGWVSPEQREALEGPTEDREAWQAVRDRQGRLQEASTRASGYSPQIVQQSVKDWIDKIAKNVQAGAQDLQKNPEDADGNRRSADLLGADEIADFVTDHIGASGRAWMDYATQSTQDTVLTALESTEAHKHLTADDKTALKKPESLAAAVLVYVGAAQRNADPTFKTTTEAQLKKNMDYAKNMERLNAQLGSNGNRVTEGAAPTAATMKPYKDRLGDITPEQRDAETAEFMKREGM